MRFNEIGRRMLEAIRLAKSTRLKSAVEPASEGFSVLAKRL
ncbi:MAG TPA: hypothetical protein VK003_03840 [Oceanobacillus sp.]|nr:hypothetical protein [Oceanobacillus sp.]